MGSPSFEHLFTLSNSSNPNIISLVPCSSKALTIAPASAVSYPGSRPSSSNGVEHPFNGIHSKGSCIASEIAVIKAVFPTPGGPTNKKQHPFLPARSLEAYTSLISFFCRSILKNLVSSLLKTSSAVTGIRS